MANQYLSLIEVDSILNTTIINSTITINTYSKLLPYLPLPFVCLFGIITNSLNIINEIIFFNDYNIPLILFVLCLDASC